MNAIDARCKRPFFGTDSTTFYNISSRCRFWSARISSRRMHKSRPREESGSCGVFVGQIIKLAAPNIPQKPPRRVASAGIRRRANPAPPVPTTLPIRFLRFPWAGLLTNRVSDAPPISLVSIGFHLDLAQVPTPSRVIR